MRYRPVIEIRSREFGSNHKKHSILKVAKMFSKKIKYLPKRPGERFASALTNKNLSNKVYKNFGKIDLEDYIMFSDPDEICHFISKPASGKTEPSLLGRSHT